MTDEERTKTDLQQAVEKFEQGATASPGNSEAPAEAPPTPKTDSGGLFGKIDPWATEPHKPLNGIEPPWDIDAGGLPRVARGLAKLGIPLDRPPAIVDLGIGLIEAVYQQQPDETDTGGKDGGAVKFDA